MIKIQIYSLSLSYDYNNIIQAFLESQDIIERMNIVDKYVSNFLKIMESITSKCYTVNEEGYEWKLFNKLKASSLLLNDIHEFDM